MSDPIQLTKDGVRYDNKLYSFGDCSRFADKLNSATVQRIAAKFGLPPKLTKRQVCERLKKLAQDTSPLPPPSSPKPSKSPTVEKTGEPDISLTSKGLVYYGKLFSLDNCAQFAKAKITKKDLEIVCQKLGCNPKSTKENICKELKAKLSGKPVQGQIKKSPENLSTKKVAQLRKIAEGLGVSTKGVLKADLIKKIKAKMMDESPKKKEAQMPVQQQIQFIYDPATDSVKIGNHRFFFGKCDVAKTYTKKQVTDMAKTLKLVVKSKDTIKILCEKIDEKVRPLKIKAPTPKAPTPKAPTPKAPTPKAPTPKAPTPKAPTPKAPTPKAPTPKAPTPKAPTPKAPTPKAPTPKAPTPKAPTPSMLMKKLTDDEIRQMIRKCLHLP